MGLALDEHDLAAGLRRLDGGGDAGDATADDEQAPARLSWRGGVGGGHRSESLVRYFTGRLTMVHCPVSRLYFVLQNASQFAWSIAGLSERT